jgi:plastocyanin
MVDVKNQKCIHEGCTTRPNFNKSGESKGLYCSLHKQDGMVNVKDPTCIHEGCTTRPVFNISGESKGLYCSLHKQDDMVDVKNQKCIYKGCTKQPTFNKSGESKGIYCSVHKQDGMVDVKSPKCIQKGCTTQPAFNTLGESKGIYCSVHKQDGMVDVKHQTCKTHLCSLRVQEKYDGYCLRCFIYLFPDKPISRNYKTKEYAVVEYIKQHYSHLPWIADKIINGGCSKRRPDLLLDLGYQILIVEIDENQHIDYDCSCENKRIMELSQDMGHRPIIFIRFNPDEYEKNGINISSCWGQDKKGICVVKKTKINEWRERLIELKQIIDYWINPENRTNKTVEIIQLFYDATI